MDEKLILEGLAKGDRKAWGLLYDLMFKRVYFLAYYLVGEKMEAEDIAIGSLCKFFEKGPGSFESFYQAKRFIYTTAQNAAIDFLRKVKRQRTHHKNLVLVTDEIEESVAELTDKFLYKVEMLQCLYEKIEELPKKCRETFKLVYLERMPRAEVAEKLNISLDTVKSHCSHAQKRLLQSFSEKELMILLLLLGLCLN